MIFPEASVNTVYFLSPLEISSLYSFLSFLYAFSSFVPGNDFSIVDFTAAGTASAVTSVYPSWILTDAIIEFTCDGTAACTDKPPKIIAADKIALKAQRQY